MSSALSAAASSLLTRTESHHPVMPVMPSVAEFNALWPDEIASTLANAIAADVGIALDIGGIHTMRATIRTALQRVAYDPIWLLHVLKIVDVPTQNMIIKAVQKGIVTNLIKSKPPAYKSNGAEFIRSSSEALQMQTKLPFRTCLAIFDHKGLYYSVALAACNPRALQSYAAAQRAFVLRPQDYHRGAADTHTAPTTGRTNSSTIATRGDASSCASDTLVPLVSAVTLAASASSATTTTTTTTATTLRDVQLGSRQTPWMYPRTIQRGDLVTITKHDINTENTFYMVMGGKWDTALRKRVCVLGNVSMGKHQLRDVSETEERYMGLSKSNRIAQKQVQRHSVRNIEYIVNLRTNPPDSAGGAFRSVAMPGGGGGGGGVSRVGAGRMSPETKAYQQQLITYIETLTADNLFVSHAMFWSDDACRDLQQCESQRLFWLPYHVRYDPLPFPRLHVHMDVVFCTLLGQSLPHDPLFFSMFRSIPRDSPTETQELLAAIDVLSESTSMMGASAGLQSSEVSSIAFGRSGGGKRPGPAAHPPSRGVTNTKASIGIIHNVEAFVQTIRRTAFEATEVRALCHAGSAEEYTELGVCGAAAPHAAPFALWGDQRLALAAMLEMETDARSSWTKELVLPLNAHGSCFLTPHVFKTGASPFIPRSQLGGLFDAVHSRGGFYVGAHAGKMAVLAELIRRRPFVASELALGTTMAAAVASTKQHTDATEHMTLEIENMTLYGDDDIDDKYEEGGYGGFKGHAPLRYAKRRTAIRSSVADESSGRRKIEHGIEAMAYRSNYEDWVADDDHNPNCADDEEDDSRRVGEGAALSSALSSDSDECENDASWVHPPLLYDASSSATDASAMPSSNAGNGDMPMLENANGRKVKREHPESGAAAPAAPAAATATPRPTKTVPMPDPAISATTTPETSGRSVTMHAIPLAPTLHGATSMLCITSTLLLVPDGEKKADGEKLACCLKLRAAGGGALVVESIENVMRTRSGKFDHETVRRWNMADVVVATYTDFDRMLLGNTSTSTAGASRNASMGGQMTSADLFHLFHWWRVILYRPDRCDPALMALMFPNQLPSTTEDASREPPKHLHITHRWICMDSIADLFTTEFLLQHMCMFLSLFVRIPTYIDEFRSGLDARSTDLSTKQAGWLTALLRHSLVQTTEYKEMQRMRTLTTLEQRIALLDGFHARLQSRRIRRNRQSARSIQEARASNTDAAAAAATSAVGGTDVIHQIRRVDALVKELRVQLKHARDSVMPLRTRPRMFVHHYFISCDGNADDVQFLERLRTLRIGNDSVPGAAGPPSEPLPDLSDSDFRFYLSVAAGCMVNEERATYVPYPRQPARTISAQSEEEDTCIICQTSFLELKAQETPLVQVDELIPKKKPPVAGAAPVPPHHACHHIFCEHDFLNHWKSALKRAKDKAHDDDSEMAPIKCPLGCTWIDKTKAPMVRLPWFKNQPRPPLLPADPMYQSVFLARAATQNRSYKTLLPFRFPASTVIKCEDGSLTRRTCAIESRLRFVLAHLVHLARTQPHVATLIIGSTSTLEALTQCAQLCAPMVEQRDDQGVLVPLPPDASAFDRNDPAVSLMELLNMMNTSPDLARVQWDARYEMIMIKVRAQRAAREAPLPPTTTPASKAVRTPFLFMNAEQIPHNVTMPEIRHVVLLDAVMEWTDVTFGTRQCETSDRIDRLLQRQSRVRRNGSDLPLRIERFVTHATLECALFERMIARNPDSVAACSTNEQQTRTHVCLHTDSLAALMRTQTNCNPTHILNEMLAAGAGV